jgi:hypothetical protein
MELINLYEMNIHNSYVFKCLLVKDILISCCYAKVVFLDIESLEKVYEIDDITSSLVKVVDKYICIIGK